jgi:hypothetical protein
MCLSFGSISGLKQLLIRCMIHPLFLRLVEGRRLLSFLFSLDASLIHDLHVAIKNQLPACRASLLTAYGEVYWRAWQLSDGQARLMIGIVMLSIQSSSPITMRCLFLQSNVVYKI